jgi:hypothetical protein
MVFNEGEATFQGKIHARIAGGGIQTSMDTGEARPWSPKDMLNIPPHGCIVLAWPETGPEKRAGKSFIRR